MNEMIAFSNYMLGAICEFLATPPVFYLFGLICFSVVFGIVLKLLKNNR